MAYTAEELLQYARDKIMASRLSTWSSQNDISYWRGLHHKYDQQLVDVVTQYEEKIQELVERYKQNLTEMDDLIKGTGLSIVDFKEDMRSLVAKALRLAEKYWAVRYEIEGRQKGFFVRKPVGTIYYIDLNAGNDANDGLSTSTAWLTIEKYTTVTVRSAGDIAYVRAATAEIPVGNILFDEDGNRDNRIAIIGCDSVVNDPWNDSSNVLPIINFNGTAYSGAKDANDYWYVERLDIKDGATVYGSWYDYNSIGNKYKSVKFSTTATAARTMMSSNLMFSEFEDCEWTTSPASGERLCYQLDKSMYLIFKKCKFDKTGVANPAIGLYFSGLSVIEIIDSEFGQISALNSDIAIEGGGSARIRNSLIDVSKITVGTSKKGVVFIEDTNQVYNSGHMKNDSGLVIKDTTIKTGSANFSIRMEPASICGLYSPLDLSNNQTLESSFMAKLSATIQKTLTIKLRANAWTAFPTADQLYLEASYYNNASTADRATIKSTQVISVADTWTDFSVTLTPQRDGIVYINVVLKKYESGKTVNVNGEVEVS